MKHIKEYEGLTDFTRDLFGLSTLLTIKSIEVDNLNHYIDNLFNNIVDALSKLSLNPIPTDTWLIGINNVMEIKIDGNYTLDSFSKLFPTMSYQHTYPNAGGFRVVLQEEVGYFYYDKIDGISFYTK